MRAAPLLALVLGLASLAGVLGESAGSSTGPTPTCTTWDPAWSPDGSRIAFGSVGTPLNYTGAGGLIETVNAAGTELHVLTPTPANRSSVTPDGPTFHHDFQPTWSPDGRRLAFTTDWQVTNSGRTWDSWSLNLLDIATGAVTQVADSAADPTWSRTGLLGYDLYEGPMGIPPASSPALPLSTTRRTRSRLGRRGRPTGRASPSRPTTTTPNAARST